MLYALGRAILRANPVFRRLFVAFTLWRRQTGGALVGIPGDRDQSVGDPFTDECRSDKK